MRNILFFVMKGKLPTIQPLHFAINIDMMSSLIEYIAFLSLNMLHIA